MSRYIDADALTENCYKQMDKLMESTSEHLSAEALSLLCGFTLINSAPSIDIVFCKECKYEKRCTTNVHFLADNGLDVIPVRFCSHGEREGE